MASITTNILQGRNGVRVLFAFVACLAILSQHGYAIANAAIHPRVQRSSSFGNSDDGTRRTANENGGSGSTVGSSSEIVANCDHVTAFFESKNISIFRNTGKESAASPSENTRTTCGGQCCTVENEEKLRHQARIDFHNLIHHHSRSLQGLLATTADALRETVSMLARQSENKTLTLFEQVYRSMASLNKPSIRALYQAMVDYVSPMNTPDTLQQPLTRDILQERFFEFFSRLFPVAYHHALNLNPQEDFTENFKTCLYQAMDEIEPFGDIPKQISKLVGKSLEATRVLIQALTLGRTVLDRTDSVLFSGSSPQQEACYAALLRMTYCPRCKGIGITVRPCAGFCTNVMRGCLTEPASELDLAWSGYVETVERLVVAVDGHNDPLGLNAEKAVRQLDSRISNAIMHAMKNGQALQEKVRKLCGRSEHESPSTEEMATRSPSAVAAAAAAAAAATANFEGHSSSSSSSPTGALAAGLMPSSSSSSFFGPTSMTGVSGTNGGSTVAHRTPPTKLHVQLGNFLASVVRSRTFYGTLADAICEEHPDKRCWNGERVGEYTKTVVDSSLTAQRYNPEFTVATTTSPTTSYGNANTSVLIDQLRHINQIVQSQLASAPDGAALLADEALDGSGSGDRPWRKNDNGDVVDNDDEDVNGNDRDDEEISGSGMGPTTSDPIQTHKDFNHPASASSTRLLTSLLLNVIFVLCLVV